MFRVCDGNGTAVLPVNVRFLLLTDSMEAVTSRVTLIAGELTAPAETIRTLAVYRPTARPAGFAVMVIEAGVVALNGATVSQPVPVVYVVLAVQVTALVALMFAVCDVAADPTAAAKLSCAGLTVSVAPGVMVSVTGTCCGVLAPAFIVTVPL